MTTYFLVKINNTHEILITDGLKAYTYATIDKIDANVIPAFIHDLVGVLKDLRKEGKLYTMCSLIAEYPNKIYNFHVDDYDSLVKLISVY